MSVFQFCLHGLSPGDCTMAIQPLEDNHQYLTKIYGMYGMTFLTLARYLAKIIRYTYELQKQ